jgi:hypothetical protein
MRHILYAFDIPMKIATHCGILCLLLFSSSVWSVSEGFYRRLKSCTHLASRFCLIRFLLEPFIMVLTFHMSDDLTSDLEVFLQLVSRCFQCIILSVEKLSYCTTTKTLAPVAVTIYGKTTERLLGKNTVTKTK